MRLNISTCSCVALQISLTWKTRRIISCLFDAFSILTWRMSDGGISDVDRWSRTCCHVTTRIEPLLFHIQGKKTTIAYGRINSTGLLDNLHGQRRLKDNYSIARPLWKWISLMCCFWGKSGRMFAVYFQLTGWHFRLTRMSSNLEFVWGFHCCGVIASYSPVSRGWLKTLRKARHPSRHVMSLATNAFSIAAWVE